MERKFAHSLRFVLPRITAPASRSRVDDERVLGRRRAGQRQRPGRRHHAVGGRDVVLDQDRDAVQRAARSPALALRVEPVGDRERVGVDLEHAVQRRPDPVDRLDAREVFVDERPGGLPSRLHPLLQVGDRRLLEIERGRGVSLVYLGAGLRPGRRIGAGLRTATVRDAGDWAIFRQGVVTNVLNPKVGLFSSRFCRSLSDPSRGPGGRAGARAGCLFDMSGGRSIWHVAWLARAARALLESRSRTRLVPARQRRGARRAGRAAGAFARQK